MKKVGVYEVQQTDICIICTLLGMKEYLFYLLLKGKTHRAPFHVLPQYYDNK
jgi:hypothetical protein